MKPEQPLQWHDPSVVVKTLQRTYKILRGNVSYGSLKVGDVAQNIDGYPIQVNVTALINTEFAVNHGLNRIPVGFHVVNKTGAGDVYKSTTAWTKTQIFLKCTTTGITVSLFIF